ncbi:MAG: FecR domain-containing protein, partial [Pseudomonadota bacterium]
MRKKFSGRHSLPIITLLSCLSMPLYAQTGDPIGVVLTTKGQVEARNGAGVLRTLTRKSELFVDDTIVVGADGVAQVRMVDNAKISFTPNTEFKFDVYEFDGNAATPDSAVMSMVRGGFRTISGTVGDADADEYRIETPMASIGIRGTTHGGVIIGGRLYTQVSQGGTTVSNTQGSLNLGIGADFDYSETEQDQPPQGLLEQPDALLVLDVPPPPVEEEDDGGDGGAEGGDGGNNQAGAGDNANGNAADGNNGNANNAGNDGNGNGNGNANNGNANNAGNANNGNNANAGGNNAGQ